MEFQIAVIFRYLCMLFLLFDERDTTAYDSTSSLAHKFDKAALDLLRAYEEEMNAIENERRLSLQKEDVLFRDIVPIQELKSCYPVDIITTSVKICPNVTEHLMAVANKRGSNRNSISTVDIFKYDLGMKMFSKIYSIPTVKPHKLEFITVRKADGSMMTLLVAGGNSKHAEHQGAIQTRLIIDEIKCEGGIIKVSEFQHMESVNVDALSSFTRGEKTYLVAGMRLSSQAAKEHPSRLLVLQYNKEQNHFEFHSSLAASFVGDIEVFDIADELFMFVAYNRDIDGTTKLRSPLYRFDDNKDRFTVFQTIPTTGAIDVESFSLPSEYFLIITNTGIEKDDMLSSVFKFNGKRFVAADEMKVPGAPKWQSLPIPNSRNTALLAYVDAQDSIDQLGFFTYTEYGRFEKLPLSVTASYDSLLKPLFGAVALFSIYEELFIAVGGGDTAKGYTIYKVEYENKVRATSSEHIIGDILKDLAELQKNLTSLFVSISSLEQSTVRVDTTQYIQGSKTFKGSFQADKLIVNNLNVLNGSLIQNRNGTQAPSFVMDEYFVNTEERISAIEQQIEELKRSINNAPMVVGNTSLKTNVNFASVKFTARGPRLQEIFVPSCIVGNVDVCFLNKDVVFNGTNDNITGAKVFSNNVYMEKDLHISKKLNNVTVSEGLLLSSKDQVITAKKIFEKGIDFPSAVLKGKLNGIVLENDTLSLHKDEIVFGRKAIKTEIEGSIVYARGLVDEVNIKDLHQNTMTVHERQSVTGKKTLLNGSSVYGNIKVSNLTNNLDLYELSRRLVNIKAENQTSRAPFMFNDPVHIQGDLSVKGKITFNNLTFPTDVVLVRGKQVIAGRKVFNAQLIINGDLKTSGLVDTVNITDAIRISKANEISSKISFSNNFMLLQNVNVSSKTLVNGIDLSNLAKEVVTVYGKQKITGKTTFNVPFLAYNCLTVQESIDRMPIVYFDKLFSNAVKHGISETITGRVVFVQNVTVHQNLSVKGLVNGCKFPNSFLKNFEDQEGNITSLFRDIEFKSKVNIYSHVNGFDLENFRKDMIRLDSDQEISGVKIFVNDVIVEQNILSCCSTGSLALANILTKNTMQVLSASKSFSNINSLKTLNVTVENVTVESTVDGVDLSSFKAIALQIVSNIKVGSFLRFTNITVKQSLKTEDINGICLKMLEDDTVTTNTDQKILSRKTFEEMVIESDLSTNSSIDDESIAELSRDIVKVNEPTRIAGRKTFKSIKANSVDISGLIHGVNLSHILENTVLRTKATVISGSKTIQGNITMERDLFAKSINNIKVPEHIVLKHTVQKIAGKKKFVGNITIIGDVTVAGWINDVNLSLLQQDAVLKSRKQYIRGKKLISSDIKSMCNVDLNGKIDGVDLSHLSETSVKIEGKTVIRGAKLFSAGVEIKRNVTIKGFVNNKDLDSITNDAVLKHTVQYVTGHKTFKQELHVEYDVFVYGQGVTTGLVNQVNISELDRVTLKTHSNQVITGRKHWTNNVKFHSWIAASEICGEQTKDYVRTKGSQIIRGRKIFPSIRATGNVMVHGKTDSVKLADIAADTLLISKSQIVNGAKTFVKSLKLKGNLTVRGKIDYKFINSKNIITLDSDQTIKVDANFYKSIIAQNFTVYGKLSGRNLSEIYNKRVTVNTKQQINGTVVIAGLTNAVDITVSGTVNGVDVIRWISSLNSVVKTFETECDLLSNMSQKHCPAFKYLKDNFGRDLQLYLDYETKQSFKYNINHMEAFDIDGNHYIAIVRALEPQHKCTRTEVMILDPDTGEYVGYQNLSAAVESRFVAFESNKEMFLFLENAEKGCMPKGRSVLYKWNFTSFRFEVFQNIETCTVRHSRVMKHGAITYLAIANEEPISLEVWTRRSSKSSFFIRTQKIQGSSPMAIEFFKVEEKAFMAIANNYDPLLRSLKALSVIYRLNKVSQKWERLQGIPTESSLAVKYFQDKRHHYVAFASQNVDVYRYSNRTGLFICDHSIKAPSPIGIESVHLENSIFLVVVSKGFGIFLYRQKLHFEYDLTAVIPQTRVTHVTAFVIDNRPYFAIGSWNNMECTGHMGDHCPRILEGHVSGMVSRGFDGC